MLPKHREDAIMAWKAAGVSDDQIKFLLDTYFPRYEGFTNCPEEQYYDRRLKKCMPMPAALTVNDFPEIQPIPFSGGIPPPIHYYDAPTGGF